MVFSASEARKIADRLIKSSRADSCTVSIEGAEDTYLRFAQNSATTNGSHSLVRMTIESHIGGRSGSVTITGLDEDAFAAARVRSEEIARLAPTNPEFMPPLGPQHYEDGAGYDAPTATVRPAGLAAAIGGVICQAVDRAVNVAGYAIVGRDSTAFATSAGLFAYDRRTRTEFTVTARNKTGTWSGWSGKAETRFDRLDIARLGRCAIDKASQAQAPIELDPGKYTVILESAAVADLLLQLLWVMEARAADEGRSFFSKKGGGNKLGERLFNETVTIYSDPNDPIAPEPVFGEDGLPQRRTIWVENGVVKTLCYSRFWAEKLGRDPVPKPRILVMAGGSSSIEEMRRDVKRGVLVTRLWYVNFVDLRTLLLTGLTRDGNFFIENGRIVGPVRNFRFNESLASVLRNIAAIGPSERSHGGLFGDVVISTPPLLVKEFTFSSKAAGI
jgi:predicted Zn-dependent protease